MAYLGRQAARGDAPHAKHTPKEIAFSYGAALAVACVAAVNLTDWTAIAVVSMAAYFIGKLVTRKLCPYLPT